MSIFTAPCSWPVSYAACTTLPAGWEETAEQPDPDRATFEEMAAEFLWRWTGRSLGTCEVTIRPCRIDLSERPSTFEGRGPLTTRTPWRPVLIRGEWWNLSCGSCGPDSCGCDGPATLRLPGPVASVSEVLIDGEVLPASAYRVEAHRYLIRQDGGVWPAAQDLSAADGSPGTWSVTYERGTAVPVGGQIATGVLAVELFKAACNDSSCGLPKRFQSITRQGVTVAMLDSFDDIDKGHTGIFLIDSWVASMTQQPRRPAILSPDVPRRRGARRTTWEAPA